MTLQSTRHEVILHGLREVTSERQVILHDPSIMPIVLMVKNGRKCITYIYYIIKQLLTYVSVDMECLNSKPKHTDLRSASVSRPMMFTVQ